MHITNRHRLTIANVVAPTAIAALSFPAGPAAADYQLHVEVSSQNTNADGSRTVDPPTIQTSVGRQDNQLVFFGNNDKNSAAYNAFNTTTLRPGIAHVLASGTTLLSGPISQFDNFSALSETNTAWASLSDDVVTFAWKDGFDDTQPIGVTFHQEVSQLNFSGHGFFPTGNLQTRFFIDRVGGQGDLNARLQSDINQNNINIRPKSLSEQLIVFDGASYNLDYTVTAVARAGSSDSIREGSAGTFAFAKWWISVPDGVKVSSTSGHDYATVLPESAVPEPATTGLLVVIGTAMIARRRR